MALDDNITLVDLELMADGDLAVRRDISLIAGFAATGVGLGASGTASRQASSS